MCVVGFESFYLLESLTLDRFAVEDEGTDELALRDELAIIAEMQSTLWSIIFLSWLCLLAGLVCRTSFVV